MLKSRKRITLALGGTQSGKTVIGPYWLYLKMAELGPGDYLVVGPYAQLLHYKVLPEFERLFVQTLDFGKMKYHPFIVFRSHDGAYRVFFAHAKNSDTLESATAKAAWLDEAGQDAFRLSAWEAIRRRLSLHRGPTLITTTPYNFDWLYQKVYLPWVEADKSHPTIEVVQFDSLANPAFSREEWEEARRTLPPWKFDMFYRGKFTRPAGLVYDVFDVEEHVRRVDWHDRVQHVVVGIDFGGTNLAAIRLLVLDDGSIYVDSCYETGKISVSAHVTNIIRQFRLNDFEFRIYGGSSSESDWRREFTYHGLPVLEPPASGSGSVSIGIDAVYTLLRNGKLVIAPTLTALTDQFLRYSWKLDSSGDPIPGEIDRKSSFHLLDALRYGVLGANRLLSMKRTDGRITLDCAPSAVNARRKELRRHSTSVPPQFIEGMRVATWKLSRKTKFAEH